MLQRALIVGKSWIPSTHRPKNHIYQQPSAESTELRVLTVPSVKSDLTLDTTYQPHFPDFEAPSPIRRRTHVQRVIGDHFTGWRFGILHFAVWATLVFLINLTVTIWGSSPGRIAPGVLMDGDCGKVKQLNVYLHILINILSTILLSGSNYSMQCLSAPTRKEVDDAHSNGRWLDIGIPSLRNIRSLSKQRIILWMMFGLSSLPLHLL